MYKGMPRIRLFEEKSIEVFQAPEGGGAGDARPLRSEPRELRYPQRGENR